MASSEDDYLTSSDEIEETPKIQRRPLTKQFSIFNEEYAIDLGIPPTFSTLIYRTKGRAPRPKGQRKPSKKFLKDLKSKAAGQKS